VGGVGVVDSVGEARVVAGVLLGCGVPCGAALDAA